MPYLFTSESVSEGHPDKIADQISDAILDAFLTQDPDSRVACETLVTTGLVVVAGEVTSKAYVEIPDVVRETITNIGYTKSEYQFDAKSCGIINALHSQSPDIARGVNETANAEQGAGDQGMMFGYASNESERFSDKKEEAYMPLALHFSHLIVNKLAEIRKDFKAPIGYLRPDAKSQVTIEYNDKHEPIRIDTIVISTQHDDFENSEDKVGDAKIAAEKKMVARIKEDLIKYVIAEVIPQNLIDANTKYHINPTGLFIIGGPHGDSGLTGRKIIVDTYGGKGAHGGGAFSGKDSSKVDRSAAYATRHIAKNLVAAGVADEVLVQVSYAIGVAEPVSMFVNTFGTAKVKASDGEIAVAVKAMFDMKPKHIVERLKLKLPIFGKTAAGGHMGRKPKTVEIETNYVTVKLDGNIRTETRTRQTQQVELFTWEKLDYVAKIKTHFGL